ncbi:NADH-cytochrome b5 reductase 2 [Trichomonascus vanleenenianus]|uniref:cytochrome-b5 reductase n=1 Tax=Trichomonascus vanleenenianus TaxID=2268995 RepID=UPI003ECB6B5B
MSFSSFRNAFSHQLNAAKKRAFSTTTAQAKRTNWIPMAAGVTAAAGVLYYSTTSVRADSKKALIGDDQWVDLKLKSFHDESHNTRRFFFELPSEEHVLGLEVASCVLTKFTRPQNGKNVIRPYTPVSQPEDTGFVEFVIKRYEKGLMTNHLFSLQPNDTLAFKGPIQKYKWTPNMHKQIALLGGGSGITPLYQLMHHIAKHPEDKTKVHLFYCNVTEGDILIKKELEEIEKQHPNQFEITYLLDNPPKNWKGETGYITRELLERKMFKPTDEDVKVFVCGPPPMYDAISGNKKSPSDQGELTGILADMGFSKDQVFKF